MSDKVGEMLREIMQDYITLASERDELMQARNGLIENNDNLHIQLADLRAQRDAIQQHLAEAEKLLNSFPGFDAGPFDQGLWMAGFQARLASSACTNEQKLE